MAGTGPASNVASSTPRGAPGAPTSLAATIGNERVVLTWTEPTDDGGSAITDYIIQYSSDAGTTWRIFADDVSTDTNATVTNLTNGIQYQFRVNATNVAGTGPASNVVSSTPRGAPGAPTSLAATIGNERVVLTWTEPTDDGGSAITDYIIQYSSDAGTTWRIFADDVSTDTNATVTNLTNGIQYQFRINATNVAGTGPASDTVSATPLATADATPPTVTSAATITFAEHTAGTHTLMANEPGVTFAIVSHTVTGTSVPIISGNTLSWTPGELHGGNTYHIEISATDAVNNVGYHNLIIMVSETNTSPMFSQIGPQNAVSGRQFTLVLAAADPDIPADPLTYTRFGSLGTITATDNRTAMFTWTPRSVVDQTIQFTVDDGSGGTDTIHVAIPVSRPGPDSPDPALLVPKFTYNVNDTANTFNNPRDVGSNSTHVFVLDNTRVEIFDERGQPTYQFDTASNARNIAVSSDKVFVARDLPNRIGNAQIGYQFSEINVYDHLGSDSGKIRSKNIPSINLDTRDSPDGAFREVLNIAANENRVFIVDNRQDDVQVFEHAGRFVGALANSSLGKPYAVAASPTHVFVTDTENNKVHIFDAGTRNHISSFGGNGTAPGEFLNPTGIAVSPLHVTVMDTVRKDVQLFDLSGNYVGTLDHTGAGQLYDPTGVATVRFHTFVADTGGGNEVRVFDNYPHAFAGDIIKGNGEGQFQNIRSITANAEKIFVLDSQRRDVQILDYNGNYLSKFGSHGNANGQFQNPTAIAANSEFVFVSDNARDLIHVFRADTGAFVKKFGGTGTVNGTFRNPTGIAANSTHVFVSDITRDDVQIFYTNGTFVTKFGGNGFGNGQFQNPTGIAVNDMHIYVADRNRDIVQVFDHSGDYISKFGRSGTGQGEFAAVRGMVSGSPHLFTADSQNHRISAFSPAGVFGASWGGQGPSGIKPFGDPFDVVAISDYVLVADRDLPYVVKIKLSEFDFDNVSPAISISDVTVESTGTVTDVPLGFPGISDVYGGPYVVTHNATGASQQATEDVTAQFAVGTHLIRWTATDPWGNTGTTNQLVNVFDTVPPMLTLDGIPSVFLVVGETYSDAGATCVDVSDPSPILTVRGDGAAAVDTSAAGDYTITYSCRDASGNHAPDISRTVSVYTTPGAPTGLSATAGDEQVELSWTAPTDDGNSVITDYTIEYSADAGVTWTIFADGVSDETNVNVTRLANMIPYQFRVSATNAAGTGPASDVITSITRTVPGAPTILTVNAGNKHVLLSWTEPVDDGGSAITYYTVEYRPDGVSSWVIFDDDIPASSTTVIITELQNDRQYEIRVNATNIAGTGPASNIVSVTPVSTGDFIVPTITSAATITFAEHTAGTHTLMADEPGVTFAITSSHNVMGNTTTIIPTISGNTLSWTPGELHGGNTYHIEISATDAANNVGVQNLTIMVSETNTHPVFSQIGPQNAVSGREFVLILAAADPDTPADTLTYTRTGNLGEITAIDARTSMFTWTPSSAHIADHIIQFTVDDGAGGTDAVAVTITVSESPGIGDIMRANLVIPQFVYNVDDTANTFKNPRDVGSNSTHVFVLDGARVEIFDERGQPVHEYNTPSNARNIAVSSDKVFVSRDLGGQQGNAQIGYFFYEIGIFDHSGSKIKEFKGKRIPSVDLATRDSPDGAFRKVLKMAANENHLFVTDSRQDDVQVFNHAGRFVGTLAHSSLEEPRAVAASPTYVFVTDTENNRVHIFDADTRNHISSFGGNGTAPGEFLKPAGITVDPLHVTVMDTVRKDVQLFDLSGNYVGTLDHTGAGQLYDPTGVATVRFHTFVADTGGGNEVRVFDNYPHAFAGDIIKGSGEGQFQTVRSITANAEKIFVLDSQRRDVQILDYNGNYLSKFGSQGNANGQFQSPTAIAANSEFVFVSDNVRDLIHVFRADTGAFVTKFGGTGTGTVNGTFRNPTGIAANSTHVFVSDITRDDVQIFYTNGTFVTKFGGNGFGNGQFQNPTGIAVNDMHIYVADRNRDIVQVFDHSGDYISEFGRSGTGQGEFAAVRGMVSGSPHLFTADSQNHRISAFSPAGVFGASWGGQGAGIKPFGDPFDVVVISDYVLVADRDLPYVVKIKLSEFDFDNVSPAISISDVTVESTGTVTDVPLGFPGISDVYGGPYVVTHNATGAPQQATEDVTAQFVVGTHLIRWTATDPWGNTGTTNQLVNVFDTVPPTLTLDGIPSVFLVVGETYSDAGATCVDVSDPSPVLTDDVDSTVDTSAAGNYTITYSCRDASGNQSPDISRIVSVYTTPGAPTGLSAISGNGQVELSWTAPTDDGNSVITDYTIEYRRVNATWITFADDISTDTDVVVMGLTNRQQYEFRVNATNAAGTGPASAVVPATPRIIPAAPTGLAAVAGNAQVELTWTEPTDNGGSAITDYIIQHSSDSGTTWITFADDISTDTDVVVTGLTNGQMYQFRVNATNAAGTGPASGTASAIPITVPLAPANLVAAVGNEQVLLTWSEPAGDGGSTITDYIIQHSSDSGTTWITFADDISTDTDVVVTGLTNGQMYQFRVNATNAAGTGPASAVVPATPAFTGDDRAPTITSAATITFAERAEGTHTLEADESGVAFTISSHNVTGTTVVPTISGSTLSWTPGEQHGGGTYRITISARDASNNVGAQQLLILVSETNEPPEIITIDDQSATVGNQLSISLSATDADVPTNTLTYTSNHTAGTIEGSTYTWTPVHADVGTTVVMFTVDDGNGGTDSENVTITVTDVTAPIITSAATATFEEHTEGTHTLEADEPGVSFAILSHNVVDTTVVPAISGSTLSWTPGEQHGGGTYRITISATDPYNNTGTQNLVITVSETNEAPVIEDIEDRFVGYGRELVITMSAEDADDPPDTLSWARNGTVGTITGSDRTATFRWTPAVTDLGEHTIRFTVDDGRTGGTAHENVLVTVFDPVNSPMVDIFTHVTSPVQQDIILVGARFDERVTGFDASDISVSSGMAHNVVAPETRTLGNGTVSINFPRGVAVNSTGHVFVAELQLDRILIYDSAGSYVGYFGETGTGNGEFTYPYGIAVENTTDRILVSDRDNKNVQIFSPDGSYLGKLRGHTFDSPLGLDINSTGHIFVADSRKNHIAVFNSTGQYLETIGTQGTENGRFRAPVDVAVDSAGRLLVVDQSNNRIQIIHPNGTFVSLLGESVKPGIWIPWGVAVNSTGHVFVIDSRNRVLMFDPSGTSIGQTDSNPGSNLGQFNTLQGIAVDEFGRIYVTENGNTRVQVIGSGVYTFEVRNPATGLLSISIPEGSAHSDDGIPSAESNILELDVYSALAPRPPTGLSAVAGDGRVELSWTAPRNEGSSPVTGYVVEQRSGGGAWTTPAGSNILTTGISSLIIMGLTNDVTYEFRINAMNTAGTGPASNVASATPTAPVVPDTTPPTISITTPSLVRVEAGGTYTEPGAICQDNIDPNKAATVGGETVDPSTLGTYVVTYDCTDAANNAATQVSRSVEVTDTTAPVITLTGAATVSVQRGATYTDASATCTDSFDTAPTLTDDSSSVDTSVVQDYTVTYSCRDDSNNVAAQIQRTVKVYTTPDAPTGLTATAGNARAELAWSAPENDGNSEITGYAVEYKQSSAASWTAFAGNPVTSTTSATVTGLTNGNAYQFRVNATNIAGTGPASNTASTTPTAPVVPDTTPPTISITTPSLVRVEAGGTYTEPGAICQDNIDPNKAATVGGETVDPSTLGTYVVTYDCTDAANNAATQVSRSVEVTDTTAPVITLTGAATVSVQRGATYTDASATCTDSFDTAPTLTDDSSSVDTSVVQDYTVTYSCRDDSNNVAAQIQRTVKVYTTPDAPTGLTATAGNARAELAWSAPENDGNSEITGYAVEYKQSSAASWTAFAGNPVTSTFCYCHGLD